MRSWSLKYLVASSSCLHFAKEMTTHPTAMQERQEHGVLSVDIIPKFHAEVPGKGIKYSWGDATFVIASHWNLKRKDTSQGVVSE